MSKIRTFIAVELSEDVREAAVLLADELRPAAGSLRWVAPENLHWTLQFLGDVEDADIPEVCRRVAEAAAALSSFRLSARGAGAFPHPGRPRTIWIGAGQGGEVMATLQAAIEKSLKPLGFRGENRRFTPHLTLGRVGRGQRTDQRLGELLAQFADYDAGQMDVSEVVVFSSELARDGPVYQVMSRARLGGE